jgi:hypothetical protein
MSALSSVSSEFLRTGALSRLIVYSTSWVTAESPGGVRVQGGEDDVIPVAFSVCSCHGNKLNSAAEPIWLWSVDLVSVVCGNATADG